MLEGWCCPFGNFLRPPKNASSVISCPVVSIEYELSLMSKEVMVKANVMGAYLKCA